MVCSSSIDSPKDLSATASIIVENAFVVENAREDSSSNASEIGNLSSRSVMVGMYIPKVRRVLFGME